MKGIDSYRNGAKQSWRGWQWNRIVRLLCGDRASPSRKKAILKDKTVLYLVGPDDIDRNIALRHGFANENLIAVDVDDGRVKNVRRNGGFAVRGSLHQVLLHLQVPVDVVVADFCCGLTNDVAEFPTVLLASPCVKKWAIISVNMMRGRDQQTNWMRESMRRIYEGVENHSGFPLSHRGLMLLNHTLDLVAKSLRAEGYGIQSFADYSVWMAPKLWSYRSHTCQYFDSIVYRWPFSGVEKGVATLVDRIEAKVSRQNRCVRNGNLKGRIAALAALRTRASK